MSRKIYSAMGLRQMLPRQTIKILIKGDPSYILGKILGETAL